MFVQMVVRRPLQIITHWWMALMQSRCATGMDDVKLHRMDYIVCVTPVTRDHFVN